MYEVDQHLKNFPINKYEKKQLRIKRINEDNKEISGKQIQVQVKQTGSSPLNDQYSTQRDNREPTIMTQRVGSSSSRIYKINDNQERQYTEESVDNHLLPITQRGQSPDENQNEEPIIESEMNEQHDQNKIEQNKDEYHNEEEKEDEDDDEEEKEESLDDKEVENYNIIKVHKKDTKQHVQVQIDDRTPNKEVSEFDQLKQRLLQYKIDVNSLFGQLKTKYQSPKNFKVQDQVNFSSFILQKDNNATSSGVNQTLNKSQSTKEIKLPKIDLKKSVIQNRQELETQKQIVGKILQDQDYILSMEYLKDTNYPSFKDLLVAKPQYKQEQSYKQSTSFFKDIKNNQSVYGLQQNSNKVEQRSSPSISKIKILKQNPSTVLLFQNNNHLSNTKGTLNPYKNSNIHKDNASPLQITKAYQQLLDANGNQKYPNETFLSQHMQQVPSQLEINNTSDLNFKTKAFSNTQKNHIKSQGELNLHRQKLNSSKGRKHFIVAYNLSETLRENRLELECNDYQKIKELITDISKKRFESRHNNINKQPTKTISKEEIEKIQLQFSL